LTHAARQYLGPTGIAVLAIALQPIEATRSAQDERPLAARAGDQAQTKNDDSPDGDS